MLSLRRLNVSIDFGHRDLYFPPFTISQALFRAGSLAFSSFGLFLAEPGHTSISSPRPEEADAR
jgi:hypothetical protein